jgi:serine phosphatase RsbU (regulator of sigma subunit)
MRGGAIVTLGLFDIGDAVSNRIKEQRTLTQYSAPAVVAAGRVRVISCEHVAQLNLHKTHH